MLDDLFGFDEIRVTSRRASSREAFAARLATELGQIVAGDLPGRERRSGSCSGTAGWPPPTWPLRSWSSAGPPTPASAPCCATADQEVPAGRLCAVRGVMADFEVVATAAGQRPAEDRGIT
jgi:hypothetical protein